MIEKTIERFKEPEPTETAYDRKIKIKEEKIQRRLKGKVIIKGKEVPWEQSRQGLTKTYINEDNWDEIATPDWEIFIQRILKHSGCHIHQGGLVIHVLEGKGYSIVDSQRFDWEQGDLIILPIKPGGVKHQHFNTGPDSPVMWMAFRYETMLDQVCVGITQVEAHPDWAGPRAKK
ncbi:MAG: cupin domain-containing protein [Dehalococcoidales bacterium]|nr:cupin domain-containing protein [Dehalococcoidales bacterium]MDZ4245525.1 cupin domain-containing protein [Dehalococcoidia bacterium]